jgi:hypothetical protein
MSVFAVCGVGLGATALLLAVVLALLLRPLSASLAELCGAKERGDFWTALSGVSLTAGTLLVSLLGFWWEEAGHVVRAGQPSADPAALFWSSVAMLRWTVAAMLAGLTAIAAMLLAFTARLARDVRPAPSGPPRCRRQLFGNTD